jgi:hypothetical protein
MADYLLFLRTACGWSFHLSSNLVSAATESLDFVLVGLKREEETLDGDAGQSRLPQPHAAFLQKREIAADSPFLLAGNFSP